ncbi:hypothetical protein [Bdellovibrio sp. NC01]|uniref:hypothetical protein n=1 Tax=Bdellovibrio sp. NC01 TaxID=2220073 RepID=UPI00115BBF5C|nr:hypothetical protein [Bdellovibrio sp. NC01]QDK38065.1 hypothetical protein DOE51_10935 [Bdellovibrio sp. NC01]
MAESMGSALKGIRTKMGFTSARSFYMALEARADLVFNYSYYMKIEADQTAPSEKVINQLANLLPQVDGDSLVAIYCQSLFPKQMSRILSQSKEATSKISKTAVKKADLKSFQQELTERQVAVIAKSEGHYFLFLLLTLAREGLSHEDMATYSFVNLEEALKDLKAVKVAFEEKGQAFASFPEYVFPKADSESLKKLYGALDSFDQVRHQFFAMKKAKLASFFKRVSPRQVDIILGHLELLFQTIRAADETDVSYNTEAISFNVSLHRGPIKG